MGNQYSKKERIGGGGFANVHRLEKQGADQSYAIKIFDVPMQNMSASYKQDVFEKEVQILKQCNHPSIIKYVDHSEEEMSIITEYADEGDLENYIKKKNGQPFSEDQAMDFTVKILIGLHYLHYHPVKRIIHRDLKPGNILIFKKPNGKLMLKIADFGISKLDYMTIASGSSQILAFSPYYTAPEIAKEIQTNDKVDIWALGVILYELVTAKQPFAQNHLFSIIEAIKTQQFSPFPDTVSPEIRNLIGKLLCKEVKDRPNAHELMQEPEIKKHLQRIVKEIASYDVNSAQVIEDQLEKYIPPQINPLRIVTDLCKSKCATTEDIDFLKSILSDQKIFTQLILQRDGQGVEPLQTEFHKKCDSKGPTITLMRVKQGSCIGGFTMKPWEANESGKWVNDSNAMLFNLTDKRYFKCQEDEKAIFCHQNNGPCFGGNQADLSVYSDRSGNLKCISHSEKTVYQIERNEKDGTNLLTNQQDPEFSISVIEVWQIFGNYNPPSKICSIF